MSAYRVGAGWAPSFRVDTIAVDGTPTEAGSFPVTLEVTEGQAIRLRTNPFVLTVR